MSMEQGAEYMKEHYGIDSSAEEIVTGLRNMLRDFYYDEVQAKPGAEQLLRAVSDAGLRISAAADRYIRELGEAEKFFHSEAR